MQPLTPSPPAGAVDKVCIGTAAIFGLRTDNHLVGQQYSWTSSIIYFGAICGVFPSLFIMQRVPAAKWLSGNTMVWGIVLMAMAGVKSFAGLMVSRFILGLAESVIFGGFGLIVSMWWKKEEQPWRVAVIYSTLSSVVNSIISYGVVIMAHHDNFSKSVKHALGCSLGIHPPPHHMLNLLSVAQMASSVRDCRCNHLLVGDPDVVLSARLAHHLLVADRPPAGGRHAPDPVESHRDGEQDFQVVPGR